MFCSTNGNSCWIWIILIIFVLLWFCGCGNGMGGGNNCCENNCVNTCGPCC